MQPPVNLKFFAKALKNRRQQLAVLFEHPVVLWSGRSSPRNFPHNVFPFRASSHFLYFAGLPLENAAIKLDVGKLELFVDESTAEDALWHGVTPSRDTLAQWIGADTAYPLKELKTKARDAATIPAQDAMTRGLQSQLLRRFEKPFAANDLQGIDRDLAQAIATLRLVQDSAALLEIQQAANVTVEAHLAGMQATLQAQTEAQVRAAMERVLMAHNMTPAYSSIVTINGEVLHNCHYHNDLHPGALLLADVGAEAPSGWAADVTRTWPVSGSFSPTQRDVYDVVLAAHDACIAKLWQGIEYRDIHLLAATVLTEGLVNLGILRGRAADLVATDVHALFFPHGVGHLLGLDVHDMEDLGDLAGYAPGRTRSDRFGLNFLRLDRPLQPGMLVTIEPGFYQVPAILQDPQRRSQYHNDVNWERLSLFADVRGIRIEDDVLVTKEGPKVLTAALPTEATAVEQLVKG